MNLRILQIYSVLLYITHILHSYTHSHSVEKIQETRPKKSEEIRFTSLHSQKECRPVRKTIHEHPTSMPESAHVCVCHRSP